MMEILLLIVVVVLLFYSKFLLNKLNNKAAFWIAVFAAIAMIIFIWGFEYNTSLDPRLIITLVIGYSLFKKIKNKEWEEKEASSDEKK